MEKAGATGGSGDAGEAQGAAVSDDGGDPERKPLESEAECVHRIVSCLLDAKGSAQSTNSVQVAINSSVIQVAKANFALVVAQVFLFLDRGQCADLHQLGLLRLLCQVLETRRSWGDGAAACTIEVSLGRNMTQHLVREVVKLPPDDVRQQAISDVLVELVPMFPDMVLSGVLAALDGATSGPQQALVKILTEVAYTTPHALSGRIQEVMGRYLPLLQTCKVPETKDLLFRAWCSLCVAMVNCATREPGDAMISTESTFSRSFGAAAIELQRARGAEGDGSAGQEKWDELRRAMHALGTAFTILMGSWQSSKDLNTRIGAMEALGHLSLVIPKDQFLTNADSLLELLMPLLTRQVSVSVGNMPPTRLMRGLCLFLQSVIGADPEIITVDKELQQLMSTLFAWMVNSGPLQCLQGNVGTELLQSQSEVLRCFEVLAETFRKEVLECLLMKVRGNRDDRLSSLLVLRHLIGSASWRPRPSAVIDGVYQLTADTDPAVGLFLGELIVALAGADFLAAAEPGAGQAGTAAGAGSAAQSGLKRGGYAPPQ